MRANWANFSHDDGMRKCWNDGDGEEAPRRIVLTATCTSMCCCLGGSTCKVCSVLPEAAGIQCRLPACLDAHCARLLPLYKYRHQGVSSLISKDMAADV